MSAERVYTLEEIEAALGEAKRRNQFANYAHGTPKAVIENRRDLVAIIEQQRAELQTERYIMSEAKKQWDQERVELQQQRAEIERLEKQNNALTWRIEDGLNATRLCFPEDLDSTRGHEAFYDAQRLCREALKTKEEQP